MPLRRARRADRQGGGTAVRGGPDARRSGSTSRRAVRDRLAGAARPRCTGCSAGGPARTAASGTTGAPAPARRRDRRRVLDGLAVADGPAARGRAAGRAPRARRRPRTSSPRSRRARCSATSWAPRRPAAGSSCSSACTATASGIAARRRGDRARATATTRRARGAARRHVDRGRRRRPDAARRARPRSASARWRGARGHRRRAGRRRRGGARRARRLPAAVRAPPRAVWRAHWTAAIEGWLADAVGRRRRRVVPRPAAARHQERLRARPLQRRHGRRRRRRRGRVAAAFERRGALGPPPDAARRGRHRLRDDRAQEPGLAVRTAAVLLPGRTSQILTRELLYTAVTRAQEHLIVMGTEAAVRAAVARPISRASALRGRLWAAFTTPSP